MNTIPSDSSAVTCDDDRFNLFGTTTAESAVTEHPNVADMGVVNIQGGIFLGRRSLTQEELAVEWAQHHARHA